MTEAYTYSVGELNRLIKELVEGSGAVAHVQVRGEVSNFKRYPSGHCYFSLKDKTGVLKCVMFRRQALRLTVDPVNGATVVAIGRIGVYERDGAYQLYTDLLVPEGTGDLMQAYEKLKNKLAAEGLFDETRKQPLPAHPQRIGIITSPAGAAVRDVIIVARSRDSGVRLLLYPVLVQGKGAAAEIAHAIDFMNRKQLADVLIVGRGGGSMEDLWAFNE
ncbi:MAG: exodeoxyribonuclease VII large subunit, partial [Succiniclasticum sp.]|nr:exodeoxyribonuclease VII large subunit [Succiniclasticum sp.]